MPKWIFRNGIDVSDYIIKLLTMILWVSISSLGIWLISILPVQNSLSLISFCKFSILLLSSGFSYHFLTLIKDTQFSDRNRKDWWNMVRRMTYVMIAFGVTGLSVLVGLRFQSGILPILCIFALPFILEPLGWSVWTAYKSANEKGVLDTSPRA